MNELLAAILILFIFAFMYLSIKYIVIADKKIIEINNQVCKIKNINFKTINKIVKMLKIINKNLHFGKIKKIFEIITISISVINIYTIYKKFADRTFTKNTP